MKTALIFPGQGSQYVKMGHDFYSKYDVSRDIYERLNRSIDRNLSKLIFSGEEELFKPKILNLQLWPQAFVYLSIKI